MFTQSKTILRFDIQRIHDANDGMNIWHGVVGRRYARSVEFGVKIFQRVRIPSGACCLKPLKGISGSAVVTPVVMGQNSVVVAFAIVSAQNNRLHARMLRNKSGKLFAARVGEGLGPLFL